jgi:integrase
MRSRGFCSIPDEGCHAGRHGGGHTKGCTPLIRSASIRTGVKALVTRAVSLPSLQRLMGHDRLTTTEMYLNLSPEEVLKEFREKW